MSVEANPYERTWADDGPAPIVTPTIIVSSKDGHGDPGPEWIPARTAPWRSIGKRAEAAGWAVQFTYALAYWPDQYHGNGNLKKQAHYVHSIALRIRQGTRAGFAVWDNENADGSMPPRGWSYSTGFVGRDAYPLAGWKDALTS